MSIRTILPGLSCVCFADQLQEAINQGFKEIFITPIKVGDKIIKHHRLRGTNRYIQVEVPKIPLADIPDLKEALSFLPAGKIPYILYQKVENFFREVIRVKGTALEAMIFVLWSQELGYHLWVPEQKVGAASVSFDPTTMPAGSSIIVNIHSHGHMNAFFSGTDDRNDSTMVQFSGVLGKFQTDKVQTIWRFNYYDTKKFAAELTDIFLPPPPVETDFPQEWLDQVQQSVPAITTLPRGGNRGQGNVGRSYDHLNRHGAGGNHMSGELDLYDQFNAQFGGFGESEYTPTGGKWRFDPKQGVNVSAANGEEEGDPVGANDNGFANVIEDPTMGGGQSHLGKSNELVLVDVNGNSLRSLGNGTDADLSDEEVLHASLTLQHGEDVADAFCLIDMEMHNLNGKDELVTQLLPDLFNMVSEDGKLSLFREIYESLSPQDQEKLQSQGL